jgi:hypothetical protein
VTCVPGGGSRRPVFTCRAARDAPLVLSCRLALGEQLADLGDMAQPAAPGGGVEPELEGDLGGGEQAELLDD